MRRMAAVAIGLLIVGGAMAESKQGPSQAVAKPVGTSQSGPEQAGRPSAPAAQAGVASPASAGIVHRDVAARSGVATGAGAAAGAAAAPAAGGALPGGAVISAREAGSGQATGQRAVSDPGAKGTVAAPGKDARTITCPDGACASSPTTKK